MSEVIQLTTRKSQTTERVLETLYNDHHVALRSFLLARVKRDEVEDIMQEVFVKMARQPRINTLLEQGFNKNRAYLFTAANNLVVDSERRKAVRRNFQDKDGQEMGQLTNELSPDVIVSAHEELSLVKSAIKDLKPKWRTIFILNRMKCMSHKEIAECMGINERQVETCLAKAVQYIRRRLEKRYLDSNVGRIG